MIGSFSEDSDMDDYPVLCWEGCYKEGWRGILTNEAFRHPAKFNYGVLVRVLEQMKADGHLSKGDYVFDPFGGVGTGGVLCTQWGYRWRGREIEKRFVAIGNKLFDHLKRNWSADGRTLPILRLGDSREPFGSDRDAHVIITGPQPIAIADDGVKEGTGAHGEKHRRGRDRASSDPGCGNAPGQTAPDLMGGPSSVITSPPYGNVSLNQVGDPEVRAGRMRARGFSESEIAHMQSNAMRDEYGAEGGQVGGPRGSMADFWINSKMIIKNCFDYLRPGGVAVWVCRDYIRGGKRVHFPTQWSDACRDAGFTPLLWGCALNTIITERQTLFGKEKKIKDYKSFFRRMAEKNGAERIDWDDCIFMRKP